VKAYEHVLAFALEHPWNLTQPMLTVVASILARRIAGEEVDRAEIEAALVNRKNLPQPRQGTVAVIPVYGVIAPRMNLFSEMSGGTSFAELSKQLHAAVNDKTVKQILFDVDSPGGSVAGNAEFAAEVMKARTKKPVIAQAHYTMASAAYQLAAACTEIVASPSALVGSIGTFSIHDDLSEAMKKVGVKRTFISAGEGKVDGNPTEPLGDEPRGRIQARVNEAYDTFVTNVTRGRGQGVSPEKVRGEWKAHVYNAAEAKRIGMIDRVATLDETLARLTESPDDVGDTRAATDLSTPNDTPQDAPCVSGQDRRAEAELRRQMLELSISGL
jgi:signal peptide peptidase SppA